MAIDPVCLMEVNPTNPPGGHSQYQGKDYYFCGPGCKVAFDRDPEHILSGAGVVPMEPHSGGHKQQESRPPRGIIGFLRRLFPSKTLSD